MSQEERDLVDGLRKIWFSGDPMVTPVELLKSIPSQVRTLIGIIDKLNNKQLEDFKFPEISTKLN